MKHLKTVSLVGGLVLVGIGGVLALTNPGPSAYETFATQTAIAYLKDEVCVKAPTLFGIKKQCQSSVESNNSEIQRIIADGTQRQNFVFFSIYTTDLSLSELLPSYHVETVGILRQFFIYKGQTRHAS